MSTLMKYTTLSKIVSQFHSKLLKHTIHAQILLKGIPLSKGFRELSQFIYYFDTLIFGANVLWLLHIQS